MELFLVKLLIKVVIHVLLSDGCSGNEAVKDDSGADTIEGGIDLLI